MLSIEEAIRKHREALPTFPTYFGTTEWGPALSAVHGPFGWLFVHSAPDQPLRAVLVTDGGSWTVTGALGGTFLQHSGLLGLPMSNERWLGSGPGRYQSFEKGIAIWDRGYVQDVGYPRLLQEGQRAGHDCYVLAAVFDLRDFTRTSDTKGASEIQAIIEKLEVAFQDAFGDRCWQSIFVKGTGDGLLVVSERDGFRPDGGSTRNHQGGRLTEGQTTAFVEACRRTVRKFRRRQPVEPKVGCGIDAGDAKQVFVLGQSDYLSPALNHAAKIQHDARDAVRISVTVRAILTVDGEDGMALAAQAREVAPDVFDLPLD